MRKHQEMITRAWQSRSPSKYVILQRFENKKKYRYACLDTLIQVSGNSTVLQTQSVIIDVSSEASLTTTKRLEKASAERNNIYRLSYEDHINKEEH